MIKTFLTLIVFFWLVSTTLAGHLYMWTDEDGKTHITDRKPPEKSDVERMKYNPPSRSSSRPAYNTYAPKAKPKRDVRISSPDHSQTIKNLPVRKNKAHLEGLYRDQHYYYTEKLNEAKEVLMMPHSKYEGKKYRRQQRKAEREIEYYENKLKGLTPAK